MRSYCIFYFLFISLFTSLHIHPSFLLIYLFLFSLLSSSLPVPWSSAVLIRSPVLCIMNMLSGSNAGLPLPAPCSLGMETRRHIDLTDLFSISASLDFQRWWICVLSRSLWWRHTLKGSSQWQMRSINRLQNPHTGNSNPCFLRSLQIIVRILFLNRPRLVIPRVHHDYSPTKRRMGKSHPRVLCRTKTSSWFSDDPYFFMGAMKAIVSLNK